MSQARPKDSSRIRGDAQNRQDQRREEAMDRADAHAKLTPEDKLARLEGRRGNSERERKRLLHAIEQRGKVKK